MRGQATSIAAWERLGSLPVVAAVLVAMNALYIALAAFGNITDYDTNEPFVEHVLRMDTTNFGAEPGENLDDDVMWRSVEHDLLHDLSYIAIIAWETLTAMVLLGSLVLWIRDRAAGYRRARALSSIGLAMMVLLFFGGFIAIGGEWFQMWKSDAWNGLEPAFRNSVLAILALIVMHLPSTHWKPQPASSPEQPA